jgi:DnaJ-class molecular chaperone
VKLKIPSGTPPGKKFRIPGQGLPINKTERGDFFAVVSIQIPTKLTAKEKAAWEKLKALENSTRSERARK